MSVPHELAKSIARLLAADDRRCLLGEDVLGGGMLGLSKLAADDENLRLRLLGSPLTNAAHVAHAGGLALAGLWPIVLLPSSAALLEALPALRELGRLPWRTAGRRSLPVLFVAPDGPGFGLGGDAAESVEATLVHVPGLEVWTAGRADDLSAALRGAADFSDEAPGRPCSPRVLLLPRRLLVDDAELDMLEEVGERTPTAVLREGDHATLFAWGDALVAALAAADACAAANPSIGVTVVELGRLAPLEPSLELLIEAARATGKLVIAHAGARTQGLGAELAATFADQAILQLDAPIRRVCGQSGLFAGHEEHLASPSAAAILDAILDVVHY
ncbi:transketolase C-terminal domain-containing protein [Nannocystaceae bacterium ST9]